MPPSLCCAQARCVPGTRVGRSTDRRSLHPICPPRQASCAQVTSVFPNVRHRIERTFHTQPVEYKRPDRRCFSRENWFFVHRVSHSLCTRHAAFPPICPQSYPQAELVVSPSGPIVSHRRLGTTGRAGSEALVRGSSTPCSALRVACCCYT